VRARKVGGVGTCALPVWYKDAAGNVSGTALDTILLDQTAPTNGSVTPTAGSAQVTVSWTGFADTGSGLAAAPYTLVYSIGSAPRAEARRGGEQRPARGAR